MTDTPAPAYATLLVSHDEGVALVRLNRPEALNALNSQLLADLSAALDAFEADEAVRCVVLTGSDRAFAAGADIKEMSTKSFAQMFAEDFFTAPASRIERFRKPIIAAVAGYALGGGCELAMMCDFIIAAETAKFGQPEINLGVAPGIGGTQRLTRFVGKSKAMDMILTGRMMDAAEAERSGLVSRVVAADALEGEAMTAAKKIAASAPLAVMMNKEMVNAAYETTLTQGVKLERRLFHSLFALDDQKEGMAAFVEKRKPAFKGALSAAVPTRRTTLAGAGALLAASPVRAAGRPRVEAPFRLSFGRPWTSVWINGEGPFRFIIDTGAELFTVKAAIAPRLGLRTVRGDLLSGGVTGLRTGELYSARDIDIAHAAVLPQAQVVVAETLDEITDGLIPAGLFGLGAVGLDWERQVLVIDRDGAPTTTGFQRAALSRPAFRDRHKLVVDGGLDGAPLRLALDTGAQGDLVLLSAAVKRLCLWDRYPDAVHGRGRGVTGDFSFRTARARSATVGPLAFDAPLVGLVDPDAVSGSTDYDGLVGIGLLRRMDWTAQVSTGSLYVRANGQGPSRLYVSGLALTDGQPARVAAIAPGSPAARTSLKVGDEVVTKSAMDRRALEWLLTGAQGETVAFEARRDGGAPFAVSIVLQPLL